MYSMAFSYKLDNYWGGIDEYKRETERERKPHKKDTKERFLAVNLFVHFA